MITNKVMVAAGFMQSTLWLWLANVSIVLVKYFHKQAPNGTAIHLRGIALAIRYQGCYGIEIYLA